MPMWTLSAAQKFEFWKGKGGDREVPFDTPGTPSVVIMDQPTSLPAEARPDFLAPPEPDYIRKSIINETGPDVVETLTTAWDTDTGNQDDD